MIDATTDGACSSGVGGWAVLIEGQLHAGWLPNTTNNQMEMYAILMAVEHCPNGVELNIVTDSKLCIGWLSLGWAMRKLPIALIASSIKEVAELKGIRLRFTKVKGHSGHRENHLVDRAAVEQSRIGFNAVLSQAAG